MWRKWFRLPWRFIIKTLAQKQGFLDPVALLAKIQSFAQPSEVAAPIELIRLATILQARGLLNAQAIQHNLDWIWPYWVNRQFNPRDTSFIPRAFSLTHINLTHRNWTAVGLPDSRHYPIVDPRGLLTPFYDSWSLDAWVIRSEGADVHPSRAASESQTWNLLSANPVIETRTVDEDVRLMSEVFMEIDEGRPVCVFRASAAAENTAWLAVVLRPFNPEGVADIDHIELDMEQKKWIVNKKQEVFFRESPEGAHFSHYAEGDVYQKIQSSRACLTTLPSEKEISCPVNMATASVIFEIRPGDSRQVEFRIPLEKKKDEPDAGSRTATAAHCWEKALEPHARLDIQDERTQFIYDGAIRTLILHTPETDAFPGPYTYKHFWFRDSAFILNALLVCRLEKRAEKILDYFPHRQKMTGYFCSQEGEWDSNGQALWAFRRFCELTRRRPKDAWKECITKGAQWIDHKRLPESLKKDYAGLFPPGFSAEHLGPNDYYYWDDFWGVEGYQSAAWIMEKYGEEEKARHFREAAVRFMNSIETSLGRTAKKLGTLAMPASPHRRLDTGAIGSLAAGYPLNLWAPDDARLLATVEYLLKNSFIQGGFFHDMSHSGLNPYLTLMIAQILMRNGDMRFADLFRAVRNLASPTGQWPEAVHPQTLGGCMGDGQHVWAAAEWLLMVRNAFVREEDGHLVLCSGILPEWYAEPGEISFGKTPTPYGELLVKLKASPDQLHVTWEAEWREAAPKIEVWLPGYAPQIPGPGQTGVTFSREARS